jgi:DNA/RNA-binding domain of Phe-tRNA-synthetase-like protein
MSNQVVLPFGRQSVTAAPQGPHLSGRVDQILPTEPRLIEFLTMQSPPFQVVKELDGWLLFWAHLESSGNPANWQATLEEVAAEVRATLDLNSLSSFPPVTEMRRLFREAGTDPTRYRPASEALLRRVLKGERLPAIHPLVDLNNCLSLLLASPCCVMAEGTFIPPLTFRIGKAGEEYASLKGPFRLEGRPLLLDTEGPLDAPITGSTRVKIRGTTTSAWLVAYLPGSTVTFEKAETTLIRLTGPASGIRAEMISIS